MNKPTLALQPNLLITIVLSLMALGIQGCTSPRPSKIPVGAEQAWVQATERDSRSVYRGFIRDYANSPHVTEAQGALDRLDWERIEKSDNPGNGLKRYVRDHPRGVHTTEAQQRLESLAKASNTSTPNGSATQGMESGRVYTAHKGKGAGGVVTSSATLNLGGQSKTESKAANPNERLMDAVRRICRRRLKVDMGIASGFAEGEHVAYRGGAQFVALPTEERAECMAAITSLLDDGADSAALGFEGFEEGTQERLSPDAVKYSSGAGGTIVPTTSKTLSALELAIKTGEQDLVDLLKRAAGTTMETAGLPEDVSTTTTQATTKSVTAGLFALNVPADWEGFSPSESAGLRSQYMAQSKQIYQQFSGGDDRTKTVDVVAFHIGEDSGSFVLVSFTVPATSALIPLLKSQVKEKMAWGVREGHIRKYLGLTSIDDENFSGFYTRAIGKEGGVEVSGGLEHKNLKNTIVQLTLLSPRGWDEAKARTTLTTILGSVILEQK